MTTASILLVEDDREYAGELRRVLGRKGGWTCAHAASVTDAYHRLETEHFDVVVLDWFLDPGGGGVLNGSEFLRRKENSFPDTWVIVYSGAGPQVEVEARASGADDFLEKGIDSTPKLISAIKSGLQALPAKAAQVLDRRLAKNAMDRLLGVSGPMRRVRDLIGKVAASDVSILVRGESGTGKELVARAVHDLSPRKAGEFVPISCPSLPEPLLESEMFGHTQGAFTGARDAKRGLLEHASGGTFFLDEVGDFPLSLQPKLLRVLENHEIRRVGALQNIKLDLRFVSATNRDLEAMLEAQTFRRDLFTRLDGFTIALPPLRERQDDIPVLLDEFLKVAARNLGCPVPEVSSKSHDALMSYSFPGNVRELQSKVDQALLMNRDGPLEPEDFGLAPPENPVRGSTLDFDCTLKEARARFEKEYLSEWLTRCKGNVLETARAIGISRNQLHRLLNEYGLAGKHRKSRPEKR